MSHILNERLGSIWSNGGGFAFGNIYKLLEFSICIYMSLEFYTSIYIILDYSYIYLDMYKNNLEWFVFLETSESWSRQDLFKDL